MTTSNGVFRLPEDVVNRIAAGEVVQRPANALKELLENSLDAKSTQIQVTVKAGGLKYLQIQDNGSGIAKEDLEIVCERFTTSKLRKYEDLAAIETYGFRGEALASISHVAHLSVQTKTQKDKCAFKASYEDGAPNGPPVPCAGNGGTVVTVEDLFYNVVARKKALRSPGEEYQKILEVVGGYAVHNAKVGFVLKKFGENTDLRTPTDSNHVDNIRTVYGNNIARELMEVSLEDETLNFKLDGLVTNVNYSTKKGVLLLFINHRLVESAAIKRSLDTVYSTYLPKNGHSFVYLNLRIDPQNVDVNVHPTKHEVHFLYEEQIVEKIKNAVEAKLLSCSTSRTLYVQSRLPGASSPEIVDFQDKANLNKEKAIQAKDLVRTDSADQKLEKFFGITSKTKVESNLSIKNDRLEKESEGLDESEIKITIENENVQLEDSCKADDNNVSESKSPRAYNALVNVAPPSHLNYIDPKDSFKTRKFTSQRVETRLSSVKSLRVEVEEKCNPNLREILANLVFIGCIDESKALIQHSTKMYLCSTMKLMEELFYQILLYDFQNFGLIKLAAPLSIHDLVMLALELPEAGWTPDDGEKTELAEKVKKLLISKGPMLLEYFSLEVDRDGNLLSLPMLLESYTPFMGALPLYVLRLATEVDWNAETECFRTFCRETAHFYSRQNMSSDESAVKSLQWTHEHVVYDALRKYFLPPREFTENGAILQIANLPDLYRVFERC